MTTMRTFVMWIQRHEHLATVTWPRSSVEVISTARREGRPEYSNVAEQNIHGRCSFMFRVVQEASGRLGSILLEDEISVLGYRIYPNTKGLSAKFSVKSVECKTCCEKVNLEGSRTRDKWNLKMYPEELSWARRYWWRLPTKCQEILM